MAASVIFNSLFLMVIHSTVSDGTLIEVTQQPKHGISLVGENITFKCIFAVSPNHTRIKVYWSKQGEDGYLHANDGNRKIFGFEDKGNYFFKLLDVRIQDSGVYYCAVIHEGRESGRGSGSQLTVCVAPTPLKIFHRVSEKYSSASTLVCKTAAFYPGNLTFNWYVNGTIISTGINITQQQNSDGLYQASSSVGVIQSLQSRIAYTCMVSHISLRTEGIAKYMIPFSDREYEFPDYYYLLIAGCTVGVLSMLLLLIIGIPLMKSKGKPSKFIESYGNGEQRIQEANTETVAYVSLDLTRSKKSLRPKHPEARTVYAQTKQRGADNKIIYSVLDLTDSKKTACSNIGVEYSQIQVKTTADQQLSTGNK
uniref:Ig-like domain-containing protein n=1 Tax=Callorhinchus milii TaxID=7868 RepID=A0A4W3HMK7_CALMI